MEKEEMDNLGKRLGIERSKDETDLNFMWRIGFVQGMKEGVRVKTNEHGDKKIFMLTVKDASEIKAGNSYEGEAKFWKKMDDGSEWM